MSNVYWHLRLKENGNKPACNPNKEMPSDCILEFMPDGIVYLWPVFPDYTNLCNQCARYPDILQSFPRAAAAATKGVLPCARCNFVQAPNTAPEQDLEALMADGDFILSDGSYHSIFDFVKNSRYSQEQYEFSKLGEYDSIGSCRAVYSSLIE